MDEKQRKRDFTVGNPTKQLLIFSMPLIATMILQNLYNLADTVIIGRFVGSEEMAAVGTCGNITNVLLMLITGATVGTSVIVAQFYGAKDIVRAKRAINNSIYIITILSLVIGCIGMIFAKEFLQIIQVKEEILGDAVLYLRIIFAGTIATSMYNLANAMSRALGDSLTPMLILIVSALLNVALNLLFVVVFQMGVSGVAYATVIATVFSAIICWVILLKKMPIVRPDKDSARFNKEVCLLIAQKGLPAALQQSGLAIGGVICMGLVNTFPVVVTSAYIAATKVEALISYPPGGLTQGMQVFTGQNVGADKFDRVKQGFRSTLRIIIVYTAISIVLFILFGKGMLGAFVSADDLNRNELIRIGYSYLLITCIGSLMNGVMFLTRSTLSGAGDASSATMLSVGEVVLRVLSAYVLSQFTPLGYLGVFLGSPISWIVGGTAGAVLYRKGDWKKKRIIKENIK